VRREEITAESPFYHRLDGGIETFFAAATP
jgi:hypothetical protein